jgi:hypothetical protein
LVIRLCSAAEASRGRPNSRNVCWSLILDEKSCHVKLEEKSW